MIKGQDVSMIMAIPKVEYVKESYEKMGVRIETLGVHPRIPKEILPHNVQVEYIEGMSFFNYRKYMDSHDFDIGLAPLANDEFSKCKYINKFLEYAIFQIPGIFTDSEPYTYIVKDGENGYLVNNTGKD